MPRPPRPRAASVIAMSGTDSREVRTDAVRALEAEFGELITQFRRVLMENADRVSPGMLPGAYKVFTTIVRRERITTSALAEALMMDKGQISRTLRTAQSKGLVVTDIVPLDRRPVEGGFNSIGRVMVCITPRGREIYARVMPEAQRTQLRLIELMSPEERLTLIELARRMIERLGADLRGQT